MSESNKVYISVGSNISPKENIKESLLLLNKEIKITALSTFYRTKALGDQDQDDYLNGVFEAETKILPEGLKTDVLGVIEEKLGRVHGKDKFSARTIDLDLILYGDIVIKNGIIKIPDPDIYTRFFLAIPLAEINPKLIMPDSNKAISDVVKLFENENLIPDLEFTKELRRLI